MRYNKPTIFGKRTGPVYVVSGAQVTGVTEESWTMPTFISNLHVKTRHSFAPSKAAYVISQYAHYLHNISPTTTFIYVPSMADTRDTHGYPRTRDEWEKTLGMYYPRNNVAVIAWDRPHHYVMSVAFHEAFHAAMDTQLTDEDKVLVKSFTEVEGGIRYNCSYLDDPEERACRVFEGFATHYVTGNREPIMCGPLYGERTAIHVFVELLEGTYGMPVSGWKLFKRDVRAIWGIMRRWWR